MSYTLTIKEKPDMKTRKTFTFNAKPTNKLIAALVTRVYQESHNVVETEYQAIIEAKKRIPTKYKGTTFFSPYDIWFYNARSDFKVCPDCTKLELGYTYMGNEIRGLMPYLQITGKDRIDVFIHPHCRCFLSRYIFGEK